MLTDDLKAHYQAVLRDLATRRSEHQRSLGEHQRAIRELDPVIANISKLVQVESSSAAPPPTQMTLSTAPLPTFRSPGAIGRRYATVSTRWAILDVLDRATSPKSASDIAEALLAEGIPTKAANFANNVSAVLSDMKAPREEADSKDGKWEITERGRGAITHIRSTRRIMYSDVRERAEITPLTATN